MSKKLCLIYNTAPRYREAIFRAIDNEYDCDWYFGKTKTDIKEMDLDLLKRVAYYRTIGDSSKLYWKCGILKFLFYKKYHNFLLLTESRSLTDYFFIGLSRILNKNVYVWTHGWYGKETKFEAVMKRWQFCHVDGIFVYGDYARKLMIKQGIPEDKIHTIYNSLHYDQHIVLRDSIQLSSLYEEHFGNNYPVLIMIGRLNLRKKLNLLLEAVAKLKNKGENYNIVFIGDGSDKPALLNLTFELGLTDNVWFYGACYDEVKNAELISNADLCVVPGDIGLTAIHVMTFGIPVITHKTFMYHGPEFEVVKDGRTGLFFERDNVDSLASSISRWFSENLNKRDLVREYCYEEIDSKWNPYFQIKVLKENLILK